MWNKIKQFCRWITKRDESKWYSLDKLDITVLVLATISACMSPEERTWAAVTWLLVFGCNALTAFLVNKPKKGK